jgi:transposase InsO family protein
MTANSAHPGGSPVRKSRYSDEQIAAVLRQAEAGTPVAEIVRKFISVALDQWAYFAKMQLDFSRPGHPSDNAFCESFNNRVRQELLNPNWFYSIDQVRVEAEVWMARRLQRVSSPQLFGEPRPRRVRSPSEEH